MKKFMFMLFAMSYCLILSSQGKWITLNDWELTGTVKTLIIAKMDNYSETKTKIQFNLAGFVIENSFYSKGIKLSKTTYKYNPANKPIELLTFDAEDKKNYVTTFKYDVKGFAVEEKTTYFDDNYAHMNNVKLYKRDIKGNIIVATHKALRENKVTYRKQFKFDANGNIVFEHIDGAITKQTHKYDNKGKIVETISTTIRKPTKYRQLDSTVLTVNYLYGEKDNLIKKEECKTNYNMLFNGRPTSSSETIKTTTLYNQDNEIIDLTEQWGANYFTRKYNINKEQDPTGKLTKKTVEENYTLFKNTIGKNNEKTITITEFDTTGNMIKKTVEKDGKIVESIERTIEYY